MITAEELIRDQVKLPSLPVIFTQLNEAVNNPRMSIADIGRIISGDVGLSARLLKIANSAMYGFPAKIDTISRAVTIIGTQQLRDLALATVVLKFFKGIPHSLMNLGQFWQHSIACGITARIMATYRRESNVERFFMAGMLHDVGRLVLCLKCPDQMKECFDLAQHQGSTLADSERESIGTDHAEVGGALVRFRNLPPSLEEVVLFHHTPSRAERHPIDAAMIHVADIIAHAMELGNSGERFIPLFDAVSFEKTGLTVNILSLLMNQVDHQFHDALQTLMPDGHV
jgi:HD-like signal output (HDOD) protein